METTQQVGRVSISPPFDKPYKEMALHCEALLTGKQEMMSTFMVPYPVQGYPFTIYDQGKEEDPFHFGVQLSHPMVLLTSLIFKFRINLAYFEDILHVRKSLKCEDIKISVNYSLPL